MRTQFADTALWLTTLTTDSDGRATASFDMPENLTTWQLQAWSMTKSTRVGEAETSAVTTKNLLVRLQAPRFFVETDEVVVSAIVHNYLSRKVDAKVSIELPEQLLALIEPTDGQASSPTLAANVPIDAGGHKRIDWRVKVLEEGTADITVKALTEAESDAMRMSFPVLVHGITKQVATTGSMRPG